MSICIFGMLIDWFHHNETRYTKRIPGFETLSYPERLSLLDVESLELRRLHADLITTYKVIFGLLDVSSNFFVVRDNSVTRGHPYKLTIATQRFALRASSSKNVDWEPEKSRIKRILIFGFRFLRKKQPISLKEGDVSCFRSPERRLVNGLTQVRSCSQPPAWCYLGVGDLQREMLSLTCRWATPRIGAARVSKQFVHTPAQLDYHVTDSCFLLLFFIPSWKVETRQPY